MSVVTLHKGETENDDDDNNNNNRHHYHHHHHHHLAANHVCKEVDFLGNITYFKQIMR
jgi:hypothetical protein